MDVYNVRHVLATMYSKIALYAIPVFVQYSIYDLKESKTSRKQMIKLIGYYYAMQYKCFYRCHFLYLQISNHNNDLVIIIFCHFDIVTVAYVLNH